MNYVANASQREYRVSAGPPAIAGMVTLYNSEPEVLSRMSTYYHQVSRLYVVDNSEQPDEHLVGAIRRMYSNVVYIANSTNEGIAHALNQAAGAAVRDGFDYLLTMDDDSRASEHTIRTMLEYIEQHPQPARIGIVAAQSDPNLFGNQAEEVLYAITSGSLLNLRAYQQCGPFMDELFIDAVDHEYCYRLIQAGYVIISLNYLHLSHRIGELKQLKLFGRTLYKWASHTPVRNYYMLRNFLYVIGAYRHVLPARTKLLLAYALTKVCLLNALLDSDTALRFRYVRKAIADFRHHRLGKLSQLLS